MMRMQLKVADVSFKAAFLRRRDHRKRAGKTTQSTSSLSYSKSNIISNRREIKKGL